MTGELSYSTSTALLGCLLFYPLNVNLCRRTIGFI